MATPNLFDNIVLFGDSITQGASGPGGLSQRLADAYTRKFDVLNRGFGGYNSEWGLTVFKQIFPTKAAQKQLPTVRLLTIWWGANDASIPGDVQHVDIEKYAENLHTTISFVTSPTSPYHSPSTRIILITPPPVNPKQRGTAPGHEPGSTWDTRNNAQTKAYAEAVKRVGNECDVPVVDAWALFWAYASENEENLTPLLSDGLHLTAEGYGMVYAELIRKLKETSPELLPEAVETLFPSWDKVDPNDIPPRKTS
ncbi:SGNH hydrolase [Clavulina sp. PMI_390]|nr:SGNH hydrolase [Clavulina sp. PMI_390]